MVPRHEGLLGGPVLLQKTPQHVVSKGENYFSLQELFAKSEEGVVIAAVKYGI